MPSTIADVGQEKGALLQRRALSGTIPSPIMTGRLAMLTDAGKSAVAACPATECRNGAGALRASGLEVSENAIRDGIARQFCRDVSRL